MRKIYASVDIGSDSIKMVVGEFIGSKLNILCALDGKSAGFKHNTITDEEALVSSIKKLILGVYDKINVTIKKVIVNIPVNYCNFIYTDATINVDNEEKIISGQEIAKVLQKCVHNQISESEELIGIVPVSFNVSDHLSKNPLGESGNSLSARTILVASDKRLIYNYASLFQKCDLEVVDITCNGLSEYYNYKNNILDDNNGVIINLGHTSTYISVYSKGIFINSETLNTGGNDIDKDIAYIYKLKKSDARNIKESFARATVDTANSTNVLKLVNNDGLETTINEYEVSEVVSSRLKEILNLSKKTINHLTKKEIRYIIITGGLTEMTDIGVLANSIFGSKVKIGNINLIGCRNNKYSVCVGNLLYLNAKLILRDKDSGMFSDDDINDMCMVDTKTINNDSILGKVFGYFFDN